MLETFDVSRMDQELAAEFFEPLDILYQTLAYEQRWNGLCKAYRQ